MMLRRVQDRDFQSIYGLIRDLGDSGPFVELRYVLQNLLQDPRWELVMVADENDEAVGLMCLHRGPGRGAGRARVTVQELVVHPGYEERGVEQRLLRFAEDYSRSLEAFLPRVEGGRRAKGVVRGTFEQGALRCRKASIV